MERHLQALIWWALTRLERALDAWQRRKQRRVWRAMDPAHREILARVLMVPEKTWTDEYRQDARTFAMLYRRLTDTRNTDVIRGYQLWQSLSGQTECKNN